MKGMKETAANVAASATAGMEKTKATVQEKVEKMSAHDPVQKEMAREKKQERMTQAELNKQEAKQHNAASKHAASATGGTGGYMTSGGHDTHTHSATGVTGYPMGTHQMSAMPGHGTGQPYGGQVEEGVARTHPGGLPGDTTGHNTRAGDAAFGTGTGGTGYTTGTGTGSNAPGWQL